MILSFKEICDINHCVKSLQTRSFSGPHFPVFGLNTEIYRVNTVLQSNTGKYGPEKTPYLDTFHAVNVPISAS